MLESRDYLSTSVMFTKTGFYQELKRDDTFPAAEAMLLAPTGITAKERDAETSRDYGVYPALATPCRGKRRSARYYPDRKHFGRDPSDDSWRGQWLSVDPMAEKYPGWSSYSYGANNPIKFIDADGRWIYIANGNSSEIFRIPYGVNKKAFPILNGFAGYQKSYIDLPSNHNEIRGELNGFYGDYAEKAPRVAEFLKNTSIPVALFSTDVNDIFQAYSDFPGGGGG